MKVENLLMQLLLFCCFFGCLVFLFPAFCLPFSPCCFHRYLVPGFSFWCTVGHWCLVSWSCGYHAANNFIVIIDLLINESSLLSDLSFLQRDFYLSKR